MSELKPCPFCGGKAVACSFFDVDDLDYMPIEVNDNDAEVTCENERCINGWYLSPKDWNTRPIEDALTARIIEVTHLYLQTKDAFNLVTEVLLKQDARIAELEAENAGLKERVAMLDVNSVYKSLGEMGYIEQTNRLHTSIAESESTIEQLIEAGKRLLDSLCIDPEEEKTVEVMNWKAVVDKVNKERER